MKQCSLITALAIIFSSMVIGRAAKPGDWPQWRGSNRDGNSTATGLLQRWPANGPKILWKNNEVGEAYSSVAVADGRIFTQGNVDGEGRIICIDEKSGMLLWSVKPPKETQGYRHGSGNGARGTPTVDGEYVFAEGGGGALTCLKAATGKVVWSLHLLNDFDGGNRPPGWGYCESPLVDGQNLIVTPGGHSGAVAALNKLTGDVVWRSTDVTDRAHYCSPIVADPFGVRQIIQFTRKRIVGLNAQTGKLLWDYSNSANGTANVATPICRGQYVFSASGYGTGGGLIKLSRKGNSFSAEEVYFSRPMANHHGGIVLVAGKLFGFGSGGLICLDFATGEIAWRNRSVRKGSLCQADGHLYCLGEGNEMALVEGGGGKYVEKGRFRISKSGRPSWAHPVVANGRLYIRDQNVLTTYDIRLPQSVE